MTVVAMHGVTEHKLSWDRASGSFVPEAESAAGSRPAGFIKGPLPLPWMQAAARLPGRTLQVALALWYLAGLKKDTTVRLTTKPLADMGVSRDAKYDALVRLEEAGLVAIHRQSGQAPLVTLLSVSS